LPVGEAGIDDDVADEATPRVASLVGDRAFPAVAPRGPGDRQAGGEPALLERPVDGDAGLRPRGARAGREGGREQDGGSAQPCLAPVIPLDDGVCGWARTGAWHRFSGGDGG